MRHMRHPESRRLFVIERKNRSELLYKCTSFVAICGGVLNTEHYVAICGFVFINEHYIIESFLVFFPERRFKRVQKR